MAAGIYNLDDLREFGVKKGWCPYFLARYAITYANVVVYSYHYLLDPKISEIVSKEMKSETCVVFDEAHNIDNICVDSMSITINRRILDKAKTSITNLYDHIQRIKSTDSNRLQDEYNNLVAGLRQSVNRTDVVAVPVLPSDVIEDNIPGNIRTADFFVMFLRRFIDYLKMRLTVSHAVQESPAGVLRDLKGRAFIDRKPLR
ncbi:UNVERIFIED_CONTAM: hypothetical protein GTU68_023399, partial [Idotea baltica]|nr:hypothetical protein [Idotea baltica]